MSAHHGRSLSLTSFFLLLFSSCQAMGNHGNSSVRKPNIVIIGAGIGGASCAYYVNQWLTEANITIIEADNRIGGRIQETSVDGVVVEIGADAWATSNRYISELAKKLKLPIEQLNQSTRNMYHGNITSLSGREKAAAADSLVVWDGYSMVPASELITDNLPSAVDILVALGEFLSKLELNYLERDAQGVPFKTLSQYLNSGYLGEYVGVSSSSFYKQHGASQAIQLFGVEPILRVIYGQDLNAHAFASLVSLTSAVETASTVKGGNAQLPKALIKESKAVILLDSPVGKIIKKPDNGGYIVTHGKTLQKSLTADVVILAAPLEWADIKFTNFPKDPNSNQPRRSWTHWYVHHVIATSLNHSYFNQPTTWTQPSDVLTTKNASTPWATIQYISVGNQGFNIYKMFCFQNITSTVSRYFLGVKTVTVKHWKYTFPVLKPVQNDSQFQAIQLDSGLYNINTMESVASAMEGSVISARNVAMMVARQYNIKNNVLEHLKDFLQFTSK